MAIIKISQLPAATEPIAGSSVLPIVDGNNTTVKATIDQIRQFVSVLDFGAVGDGVANDTAAIQAAVNASKNVFFPAGYTFKITSEIVFQDDVYAHGNGEIFISQNPYVRGFRLGNGCTVDGLKFRGTNVATQMSGSIPGGQRGVAIAAFNVSNVRVMNCQFNDFVSNAINVGAGLISFGYANNCEASNNYFDDSNDGFIDIEASYLAGDCVYYGNISYSNSDLFIGISSVGSNVNVPNTEISTVSHHVISSNIHIKKRGQPIPAGRTMGRHGIGIHYTEGKSFATIVGNIIGVCSRHGIYMRGNEPVTPKPPIGPNLVSGNYFVYCGNASGDVSGYHSGIMAEVNQSAVINGNHFFKSGYFPDGSVGLAPAYDILTTRGTQYVTISNNVMREAKNGAIFLNQSIPGYITQSLDIHDNQIINGAFGIFVGVDPAAAACRDIKIHHNSIQLTGATAFGFTLGFGIGFELPVGDPYTLEVCDNTIIGTGKTADQYGITLQSNISNSIQSTAKVCGNTLKDLEVGLASFRASANSVEYIAHRVWGIQTRIADNRFVSCGTALSAPKNAVNHLALVDGSNAFYDCTTTNVERTVTSNPTAVIGRVIGLDSSNNSQVELQLTAIPTTEQYYRGDTMVNPEPSASGYMGEVCVTSGTPGTWKTYGAISA